MHPMPYTNNTNEKHAGWSYFSIQSENTKIFRLEIGQLTSNGHKGEADVASRLWMLTMGIL